MIIDWFDRLKWLAAMAVVVASVWAYYAYEQESELYRAIGLLLALILAGGLAATSKTGSGVIALFGDARQEVRKVVWPTRKETMQTTLVVLVIVAIASALLLLLDAILRWAFSAILGT